MLCKCSGKYIDIYFILKITFSSIPSLIAQKFNVQYFENLFRNYEAQDIFTELFYILYPSLLGVVLLCLVFSRLPSQIS